jgi:hypothetical protein
MTANSDNGDIATLSRDLADRAEAFCRHYFPQGRKQGNYWQLADTSGAAGQSLAVRLHDQGGRKAGNWSDYANGDFGDLIDLLHENLGNDNLGETLKEARSFLGESPSAPNFPSQKSPAVDANQRIQKARKLFELGKPTYRTLASAYLLNRCIKRFGPALRYHPTVFVRVGGDDAAELEKRPALLAKITNNDGIITGCARTFLDPKTKALADMESPKRVLGQLHGNAIRFGAGSYSEDLIAGEGLENVLSVGTALPKSDLASCLTANHLGMFIPPEGIKRLWIARDNDEAGEQAAQRLRMRAESMGLWCADLVPDLSDFNKDLTELGLDHLCNQLSKAMKKKLKN